MEISLNLPGRFYEGPYYLNLMAVRTQVDEIEKELAELIDTSSGKHLPKNQIIRDAIRDFARKSNLASLSMENLAQSIELPINESFENVSMKEVDAEILELERTKEFLIMKRISNIFLT